MRTRVRYGRFGGHWLPAARIAYWESVERTILGTYGQYLIGRGVRVVFSGGPGDRAKDVPSRPYEVEISGPPAEVERLLRWLRRWVNGGGPTAA